MDMTTKEKQYLKSKAHFLKPVVMIGNNGLTEGVIAEINLALNHHELIRVKIAAGERETKKRIASAIVRETGANLIELIGSILVLYRPSDNKKTKQKAKQ